MSRVTRDADGFTLIELLVVVLAVAALASITVTALVQYRADAERRCRVLIEQHDSATGQQAPSRTSPRGR